MRQVRGSVTPWGGRDVPERVELRRGWVSQEAGLLFHKHFEFFRLHFPFFCTSSSAELVGRGWSILIPAQLIRWSWWRQEGQRDQKRCPSIIFLGSSVSSECYWYSQDPITNPSTWALSFCSLNWYSSFTAIHCLWVQKMTVLSVNDYCNGDCGAQPASLNSSLETKETKAGPLWDDCSSRWAPLEVTVRSGLKHSPCNWAFTHNAAWKFFFLLYSDATALNGLAVWTRAGRFIFTEATAGVT